MQLKDVEELTALSSKAIRLYEEKGLITVTRNLTNGYRDYSEDNIQDLKKIKILRYLDLSIQDIRTCLELPASELSQLLSKRLENLREEHRQQEEKINLLQSLIPIIKTEKDWSQDFQKGIDFLESDIYQEVKNFLLPSFWGTLFSSLLFTGPFISLFLAIDQGKTENLKFLVFISLGSTVLMTLTWRSYLISKFQNPSATKTKNRRRFWLVPGFILTIFLTLASIGGLSFLIQIAFLPKDWLFYEFAPLTTYPLIFSLSFFIFASVAKLSKNFSISNLSLKLLALASLISLPIFFSGVTVVTKNQIINWGLLGTSKIYSYSDVKMVKTGFGSKSVTLNPAERRGTFAYSLVFKDRTLTFMTPTPNDRIYSDRFEAYLELEYLDKSLMDLGIKKTSSSEFIKDNDLDPIYQQRFLRIIQNK